ncbi:DUF6175 family protein [Flavobacteriaceae bacterium]|nr:DUF6175 family protein [Flavobacteriaceae bacterium]MDB4228205.1 DUF6175 family protein [Flavobacteriaceae bacterium]MDB4237165.1 DUF6175 family protein [Flavobacteriaceae bacterium]MDB9780960.1 DUF6175 family protein [Flavobacteriaceae bacterium]MDB9798866.1 DUF6175 family protein [Flavobacteriaceae bacterium]
MKFIKICIVALLIVPINSLFSQTNSNRKVTEERTRNWQYESICSESGGTGSSYLLQVTSYVGDLRLALNQAKKNAIHAVLFKGVAGNNLGCTAKEPLIENGVYNDNFEYFEDFFYNTRQYNQFATSPSGSAESSEKLKRKMNRVTFIISVNVDELRKKLEYDKIIVPLGDALGGGSGLKPKIMIFPSDGWLMDNGYAKFVDNQGVETLVPNYTRALLDKNLNIAISTLDKMVSERGYPTVRLAETMKGLNQGSAMDNAVEGRDGSTQETSIMDELLNVAKADIIWKVTWSLEGSMQKYVNYGIDALDAYTNKSIGVSNASGPKSMSASVGDLLRQAVTDQMDGFLARHQDYFKGIVENGREISLEFKRFDSFEYYFNDDVEFKGREMEFSSLIRRYIGSIAKNKNFSFNPGENKIDVSQIKIEMEIEEEDIFEEGKFDMVPNDAKRFADKISRFIKKQFGYPSKVTTIGLGKARITVGSK